MVWFSLAMVLSIVDIVSIVVSFSLGTDNLGDVLDFCQQKIRDLVSSCIVIEEFTRQEGT